MMNIQPSMIDEKEIRLREHAQVIIKKLEIEGKWYNYTLGAFA